MKADRLTAGHGKWDGSSPSCSLYRLTVQPDLSARFGALPIKKIDLEEGQVSFDMTLPFGDNEYEISLEGKLKDGKITGKLTSSQGVSEVTGTKIKPILRKK